MGILNVKSKFLVMAFLVVAGIGVVNFTSGSTAFATTADNWIGTACNVASPATPDCNWSTASNWSTGVPTTGASIVFDTAVMEATNAGIPTNDIDNLSIGTIIFTGSGVSTYIQLTKDLTVTSGITDETTSGVGMILGNIKLGADINISAVDSITIGQLSTANTLNLNGHKLSFIDVSGTTDATIVVNSSITGAGSIVYNGSMGVDINGINNNYSGSTQILTGSVKSSANNNANLFGTSSVYIANGADVIFNYSVNTTVNNTITIQGVTSGSQVTSLDFTSLESGVTVTIPNIILNGSTRFYSQKSVSNMTINLAGIKTNGNCIEYLGGSDTTDGPSNGFINGPVGCTLSESVATDQTTTTKKTAVKAPNTAVEEFVLANPIIITVLGIVTVATLALATRRQLNKK
jgi:hypothetical protein